MTKLFILIKKKGKKGYLGAIPSRPNTSSKQLRSQLALRIRPGFSFKIVTLAQLKKVIVRQRPKIKRARKRKKKIIRKRSKRRIKRKR